MYFGTVHEYIKSTDCCSKFAKLVEDAGPSIIVSLSLRLLVCTFVSLLVCSFVCLYVC